MISSPLCRALCRCQSAFLSTCLVELYCRVKVSAPYSKRIDTHLCFQQSLVFDFKQKQFVSNSLMESGPLLAKCGCIPKIRASKMLNKLSMFAFLLSAKRVTHVDSILKKKEKKTVLASFAEKTQEHRHGKQSERSSSVQGRNRLFLFYIFSTKISKFQLHVLSSRVVFQGSRLYTFCLITLI